jgi:hypothetical protein
MAERSADMQLQLSLLEEPPASSSVWEQMEEQQRKAAIEVLARLIAQAAKAQPSGEQSHD